MSKNKKNADSKNSGAQKAQNNMSYSQDKKSQNASDCHKDQTKNNSETNCR